MPLSSDPAARERQMANLRSSNSLKHGANSEAAIRPLRERYLTELREEFPSASERRLIIQAHRLGQLDLLAAFADERGVIRHRRRGDVFPAASLAEKIATAYLAEHDRLEAQQCDGTPANPKAALDTYLAEHYGDENEGDDPA